MAKCKLTPEVSEAILDFISKGSTDKMACQAAGIDPSTFRRWVSRGESSKSGQFYAFYMALKKARTVAFHHNLDLIRKAATEKQTLKTIRITTHPDGTKTTVEESRETPKQWQAAAWILERKYPVDFSKNRPLENEFDNQPLPWFKDDPDPLVVSDCGKPQHLLS